MKDRRVTVVWSREFMAAFSRMDIRSLLVDGNAPDLVRAHLPGRPEQAVQRRARGMGLKVLPVDVTRFPVYVEQLSCPCLVVRVRVTFG
jgi:hypothetical protein